MQQINLLSNALLPARPRFPAALLLWALLGVSAIGTPFAFWFWYEKERALAEHERIITAFDALNAEIQEQALRASLAAEDQDHTGMARHAAQQRLYARLQEISRPARFSERLRELAEAAVDGVWLTEIELYPGGFRLKGRALDADLMPDYLRRLAAQPGFTNVAVGKLEMEAGDEDEVTSITFAIDSEARQP